ncbi:MAG: SprT family zinc-dependent metalloprotease [Pseudomonadota bacterium]
MFRDNGQKMALTARNGSKVTVRMEVNPRAKRLILRLDEKAREAVAVAPRERDLAAAAAFASERVDWIAANLSRVPEAVAFAPGAMIPLRGEPCRLSLEGEGRRARLVAEPELELRAPGAEETFAARVTRYLKGAATSDLGDAVQAHCEALGVEARRISVKDTRSRWGSCTSDGRLSFSWRLICAPPEVLDYVAAHECAHLLEMNHSDRFWSHVARVCPDWKRHRNWLRSHGRELHAIGG